MKEDAPAPKSPTINQRQSRELNKLFGSTRLASDPPTHGPDPGFPSDFNWEGYKRWKAWDRADRKQKAIDRHMEWMAKRGRTPEYIPCANARERWKAHELARTRGISSRTIHKTVKVEFSCMDIGLFRGDSVAMLRRKNREQLCRDTDWYLARGLGLCSDIDYCEMAQRVKGVHTDTNISYDGHQMYYWVYRSIKIGVEIM